MLIEVTHERSLCSAAEAEGLMKALRVRFVGVDYLRPQTPSDLSEVVECFDPKKESSVSFQEGSLPNATKSLRALVASVDGPPPFGYLDVRSPSANLRVWPTLHSPTWLDKLTPQKNESASKAPFWVEDRESETALYPASAAEAVEAFLGLSSGPISRCFITGITSDGRKAALAFLNAVGAKLSVRAELKLHHARALTERYGEAAEWKAEGIRIRFPAGTTSTFFTGAKGTPSAIAKWHKRIDRAHAKAGIES